jgi:uncharacterized protein YebE (UPF0316 family)
VSKGEKYKAPIIGFFEVLIWIVVISEIFARAHDMVAYVAYAAGYASGNFVGILIEQRIAFGIVLFRVYTKKSGKELVALLSKAGFGATTFQGCGSIMTVDIVETVVNRKAMRSVEKIISSYDPDVFYVAEDVRSRQKGIFPKSSSVFSHWRLGK